MLLFIIGFIFLIGVGRMIRIIQEGRQLKNENKKLKNDNDSVLKELEKSQKNRDAFIEEKRKIEDSLKDERNQIEKYKNGLISDIEKYLRDKNTAYTWIAGLISDYMTIAERCVHLH